MPGGFGSVRGLKLPLSLGWLGRPPLRTEILSVTRACGWRRGYVTGSTWREDLPIEGCTRRWMHAGTVDIIRRNALGCSLFHLGNRLPIIFHDRDHAGGRSPCHRRGRGRWYLSVMVLTLHEAELPLQAKAAVQGAIYGCDAPSSALPIPVNPLVFVWLRQGTCRFPIETFIRSRIVGKRSKI